MWPAQVIARIEGGLGNQLFQYAAARSLADRLGCDLALDLRGLAQNGDRPFQLDLYRIRATVADAQLLSGLPDWRSSRWGRMRSALAQKVPILYDYPVFWSKSFAFDTRFERIKRPVFLVGYWQSERYFDWNRLRILRDIQLVTPMSPENPTLQAILGRRSVALHIRRGDYVTNPAASRFHGLCDINYYYEAVRALHQRFSDIEVFVFSDEPAWAKAHLSLDVPTYYVESNPGHIDLELMRHCQHHVIANSSFSWWGAWLSESAGQVVYAPRRWFADSTVDTSDVVPGRWMRL
ncbi:MAG: alpha-1,2-fucosyltransferase [Hylemonella sp.]